MHLAIEREVLDDFPPIGFECRSEVMKIQAAKPGHQPIRGAAGKLPRQPGIPALKPPSAHDVVPLVYFCDEGRYFRGIMLQIAIHGNDDVAAREVESCFQAGSLAEVLA